MRHNALAPLQNTKAWKSILCSFIPNSSQTTLSFLLATWCKKEKQKTLFRGWRKEKSEKALANHVSCLSLLGSSLYHVHAQSCIHTKVTYKVHTNSPTVTSIRLSLPSLSLAFCFLVQRHLWCDSLITTHSEEQSNGWKTKEKIKGGGRGGEAVSYHLFLLYFCCFPSICSLPSSTFRVWSL